MSVKTFHIIFSWGNSLHIYSTAISRYFVCCCLHILAQACVAESTHNIEISGVNLRLLSTICEQNIYPRNWWKYVKCAKMCVRLLMQDTHHNITSHANLANLKTKRIWQMTMRQLKSTVSMVNRIVYKIFIIEMHQLRCLFAYFPRSPGIQDCLISVKSYMIVELGGNSCSGGHTTKNGNAGDLSRTSNLP